MTYNSIFEKRTIRVFISSTFRDMVEDRNALMTHCWPELRRFCRERQVELVEVDLRWGIAEEQSKRKETLKLCLDEIRACRPFFIGLLGERYGWVPDNDAFTADLKEEQPWLKTINGRSVTELEILHGVLNNPEMAGRAFFYFRNPKYIETVSKEKKADFLSETHSDAEKQTELKKLIRKTCTEKSIPLKENYSNPQSLAVLVLEQLKAAIEYQFPIEDIPEPLTREARDHETFAESRRRLYIERPDYYDALNRHCNGAGKPILLLGESGSGKSSLIANWVERWRKDHPLDYIFQHYTGGTSDSAVHWKIMIRLIAEIKKWSQDPAELPKTNDDIQRNFAFWLNKARLKSEHDGLNFIVIIDALNQLDDKDYAHNLGWLPVELFNGNLRLIVSTLAGSTFDAIKKKGLEIIHIEPLSSTEKTKMTERYLKRFGKMLDTKYVEKLAKADATSNPLYLKIVLDELRITGTFDNLEKRLDDYLSAKDIPLLLQKVLMRYQLDYEHDRKGLVGDALGLIWAARRGLTEIELLELLAPKELPQLPLAIWSPLRAALEDSIIDRCGILNLSHDFLRKAIQNIFMKDWEKRDYKRLQIADYYEKQIPNIRSADELPWLLKEANSPVRVLECIINLDNFILIHKRDSIEMLSYWTWLGKTREMGKAYLDSYKNYKLDFLKGGTKYSPSIIAINLSYFLDDAGKYQESEFFMTEALDVFSSAGYDNYITSMGLNNLGLNLINQGKYIEAKRVLINLYVKRKSTMGNEDIDTLTTANNLGLALVHLKEFVKAYQLFTETFESRIRVLGANHPDTLTTKNNIAATLFQMGEIVKSIEIGRDVLNLRIEKFGLSHPDTLMSMHNLGWTLIQNGEKIEGEQFCQQAYEGRMVIFGEEHSLTLESMNVIATIYMSKGKYNEAESLLLKIIEIQKRVLGEQHISTITSMDSLSFTLVQRGKYKEAELWLHKVIIGLTNFNLSNNISHPNLKYAIDNYIKLLTCLGYSKNKINDRVKNFGI